MARSLKAVTPRGDSTGFGNWLARLLGKIRRRPARIDHLNKRMLRDIGLSERELAKRRHSGHHQ
jgi:hypothetical protein